MRATLVGCGAVLLWSCLAILTAATGAMPPFALAATTFAIGGTVGITVVAVRGRLASLRQPAFVWLVGVGGLFGYHALYFAALRAAPPAQAGLIAYLWPLLIVLFSAMLPGERLLARHVLGALLGFAGVSLLILGREGGGFEPRFATGYALAFACAFVWSTYSVLSRRRHDVPTDAVAGFCLATAALAGLAHIAAEPPVATINTAEMLAVVCLGLGPVGLAFYLWDFGVKNGDIRLLGVASYAAPVLSTLILVAFGFARLSVPLALACGLIVAGAAIAAVKPRSRQTR